MLTVSTSLGTRFENILLNDFPDFERTGKNSNLPDFINNYFWAEAKVGYVGFGVRLKDYQIKSFRKIKEPTVYIIGFHDFENSMEVLGPMSERRRQNHLVKNMRILRAYLVSKEIVEGIFNAENRINKKRTINYCMLKERFLRNIINNQSFERSGKMHTPKQYYHLTLDDFILQMPDNNPVSSFPYGVLLNKSEEAVLDYFREKGIFSEVPF